MPKGFQAFTIAKAFSGINQSLAPSYLKPGESPEAYNADTSGGILSVASGFSKFIATALPDTPVTPMIFYDYDGAGVVYKYYIAATADNLYLWNGLTWQSIIESETISNGNFSFVNFRDGATSKLILSNGVDAVFQLDSTDGLRKLYYDSESGTEAPRGACLATHEQRLWVAGSISAPNMFYWSDDGNPTNWTSSPNEAGEFALQNWDGGRVIGLAALLGDIVVFEENCMFRIVGTYPTEFTAIPVFTTEGTIAARSICQYNNRAYFVSDDGIMVYDTSKAYTLLPKILKDFWSGVNLDALSVACGTAYNGKLYMAVPYGTGQLTNNRVIEYDLSTKEVAIRKGISVSRFIVDNEDLLFVGPGNYIYQYGDGTDYDGTDILLEWKTPPSMLGTPYRKFSYDVTVVGYCDDEGGGDVQITLFYDGQQSSQANIRLPHQTMGLGRGVLRGSGRLLYLQVNNVSGSRIHIESISVEFDVLEDV